MKKSLRKNLRAVLAVAVSLAIGVAFMPANAAESHAATFSTSSSVSGLVVSAADGNSITLKWNAYSGATGYQVYRTPSTSEAFTYALSVNSTSCKRTGLTSGKSYYYKVRAYKKDSKGKVTYSKFSPVVTGTTKTFNPASQVSGLLVSSYNESSVSLKWTPYDAATGYEVYKAASKDGTFNKVMTPAESKCKVTGLKTKETGYYKVRAFFKKANGTLSYSSYSPVIAATPIKFTEGKIGGYKLSSRTYSSVSFVWNSYPEATGYQVYKASTKNGKYTKLNSTKSTAYNRTKLTTNKTCYYKVRAYKKSGGKTIYTKFTAPIAGTPKLLTPTVSAISSKTGVNVKWAKVSGATGYEVYRATSQNGSYSKVKSTKKLSFSNTSLKTNKEYYYKVRAYRTISRSKKYSSFSSPQLGVKAVISRVSGVSAMSQSDCIGLTWTAVSGASGYEVYRATGSNKNSYTNVGNATTSAFNDFNVANGLTYYYKIRAYRTINGVKVYGDFSAVGFSRSAVVSTAVAWLGCKESNKSNKPIVDLYNSNMGTNFSYKTPWCAIFVSAVAIKSGTTSIIVRGSYCPSVINVYKKSKVSNYKYGAGSSYVPKAGDVIFFDWNRNGVPDHTGLVASVSGNTVKTIEGNYSDAVGYRTFSVGYKYVQGYGLPNYDDANGIVFTGNTNASVGCGELSAMGIGTEPEGIEDLGSEYDFVEQNVEENIGEAEDVSDYDKMVYMVSKVRASAETEGIDCAETQYYAAFIYKLSVEEGLDASIMTVEDEEGTVHAWVEVCLDDTWYTVDASKDMDQIVEFVPETTDVEGAVAEAEEEYDEDADAADMESTEPEEGESE
ncbi:MAG: fibronectin type III domain-containing protein [Bacillota bacterium]